MVTETENLRQLDLKERIGLNACIKNRGLHQFGDCEGYTCECGCLSASGDGEADNFCRDNCKHHHTIPPSDIPYDEEGV